MDMKNRVRENVQTNINWIIENRENGAPSSFGRKVGAYSQKVNNWRQGNNMPDLVTIETIADVYDVSLDWLIGGDESKAPKDYR